MASSAPDCVKVAIRVRPLVNSEIARGCREVIDKTKGEPQICVSGASQGGISGKSDSEFFTFSHVFMPEDPQEQVYEDSVKPLIGKLFEGYNVTILAYGQTGSGKTYTMGTAFDGNYNSGMGVIPRATLDIFKKIDEMRDEFAVTVTCSFIELYQETLYDLLSDKPREQSVCDIREERAKGVYIPGVTKTDVHSPEETSKCLLSGSAGRAVGATAMNSQSSRSHAIFTIDIKTTRLGIEGESTNAKFHLVDLAGSERSKKTKATGERFKEGVKINQGLFALGNVISALGGGSGQTAGGHISYRDSKLTRLLQDSLGGNSVTLMIACISPADYNMEETVSTLRYANRAKKIKNKPRINQDSQSAEIQRLNEIIQSLRVKLLQFSDENALDGHLHNNSTMLPGGFESVEQEKKELMLKLRDHEAKMTTILASMCEINCKNSTLEHHVEELHKENNDLIKLLLQTCPAEFAVPDTKIFEEIKVITDRIQDLIKKFDSDIEDNQTNTSLQPNKNDVVFERKAAAFAQRQMDFQAQLKNLDCELRMKESILSRKAANASLFVVEGDNERTILEYESVIKNYEKELDELRSLNATKSKDAKTIKLSEDRRLKIKQLENELAETKKKARQYEKTKRAQEQDRRKIEDLQREIQEMKSYRVRLLRESRQETENYKKWMHNREKEITHLKEMSKKQENAMKRMNMLHEKQQQVLKRKVEEAKAINKRLQDAIEKGKKVQMMRNNAAGEKTDVIQTWIDHELSILMSITDAQISLKSLMKDRGLLTERLSNLKATVQKSEDVEKEIEQLEEDLEMRNAQISDLNQKVVQTDLENKLKALPENFSTLPELKIALRYVLMAFVQLRKDFSNMKVKSEDMKICLDASEERCEALMEDNKSLTEQMREMKNSLEKEYEDKLVICIKKFQKTKFQNGEKSDDSGDDLQLGQKLVELTEENDALKDRIQELEAQLRDGGKKRTARSSNQKSLSQLNETFAIEEDLDDSDEDFDFNDSFNDPDWVKTPNVKNQRKLRNTLNLLKESITNNMEANAANDESTDSKGTKRSSKGKPLCCKCQGSCATKQCGCKRNNNFCTATCKCSIGCVNKKDISGELDNDDEKEENIEGSENDDEETPVTPKRPKADPDVTPDLFCTPYYPYENKKREPFLRI